MLITGIVRPPRADYRDTQLGISKIMQEPKISLTMKSFGVDYKKLFFIKERKYN